MSNLSDIGFDVRDEETFDVLINAVYPKGVKVHVNGGWYVLYTDPSGAELWLQINNDNKLIGINPHFSGRTKRKIFITASVERRHSILDSAYHAWADPTDNDDPESGDYPFVFDVPGGKSMSVMMPSVQYIQLTAFAQDINLYQSEKEFYDAQTTECSFASRSFVPTSLLKEVNNEDTSSDCLFAGCIKEFELLENKFTGQKFYWLRVDTLGGETDVVADIKFFNKEPVKDGIIYGSFWLSARFVQEEKKAVQQNFLQRLFRI